MHWPLRPDDIHVDDYPPELLTRFLTDLITGSGTKTSSGRTSTHALSFAQDLLYSVSNGKLQPPKHILLHTTVKALTGNNELVTILNRLGHGVSYSIWEENEKALCLQKLATMKDGSLPLPKDLHLVIPTQVAWDNIGRLMETCTGAASKHRVNGIAVQPVVYGRVLGVPSFPYCSRRHINFIPIMNTVPILLVLFIIIQS